jgi:diacylglycerol kinase (ATP)
MDVVLLHNPDAGDGDRSGEDLAKLLRQHGYRPTTLSLDEAWEETDPLKRAEFIIVAGGDGSVKQVALALAHRGRPIAPLPMGTANNIATSLGVKGEAEAIIAGWKTGRRRRIDLGCATGPWGQRRFIEGIGLGLIGRAINTLEAIDEATLRKFANKEDKLYRDLCVLFALAHEMPPLRIEVQSDDQDCSGEYLLLEILNISRAGPGFELAQQADPSDGLLDVVSVRTGDREKLEESVKGCLKQLAHGTTLDSRTARSLRLSLRAGELRIDDDIVWPRADGPADSRDGLQSIEVEVTVEPGALEFVLPAGPE